MFTEDGRADVSPVFDAIGLMQQTSLRTEYLPREVEVALALPTTHPRP